MSSKNECPIYSPFLENDCIENPHLLHQNCPTIFESEANKVGDTLAASTEEFVNSNISLICILFINTSVI